MFGLDVKLASGQVDRIFFCSNDEVKVNYRREKPMAAIARVRAYTLPNCTGMAETTVFCMEVE